MTVVPKAFPNRRLPEKPYTRLFRCKKCGHYMLYDGRVLPGAGCLNCGSTRLEGVVKRLERRQVLRFALTLLCFGAAFAGCMALFAAAHAPAWMSFVLAGFFAVFCLLMLIFRQRSHDAMLFEAAVREFEDNAEAIRSSFELSAEELEDSLTPSTAVEVYLALREMSFVCDTDQLKRARLRAMEFVTKTPLLDFETDELITSDIDPYSDTSKPDVRLLRYLRIARRLSPHKVGPASEAILAANEDVRL